VAGVQTFLETLLNISVRFAHFIDEACFY
jgi:hypothetical protein